MLCFAYELELIVNGGLAYLRIQAPPPPLVKSTSLGSLPFHPITLPTMFEGYEGNATEERLDPTANIQPESVGNVDIDDGVEQDDANSVQVNTGDSHWHGIANGQYRVYPTSDRATSSKGSPTNDSETYNNSPLDQGFNWHSQCSDRKGNQKEEIFVLTLRINVRSKVDD